jgi:hypothetical protein
MRHFLHEAVVHVGDFEHTKIFRSVRALLFRPGLLTNEYIAARRVDWISPLKAFVTVFAITFFLYSAFKSVAVYDVTTFLDLDPRGTFRKEIARLAERRQLSFDAFVAATNATWRTYISLSQFIYPALFAVFLMLLYRRQRRYFVEHLVFSTHYQTFALVATVLAWPLYLFTGLAMSRTAAVLAVVMTTLMIGYLVVALRNVYRESWPVSSIKGVFLYACYYLIYFVMIYGTMVLAIVAVARAG